MNLYPSSKVADIDHQLKLAITTDDFCYRVVPLYLQIQVAFLTADQTLLRQGRLAHIVV